MFELRNDDLVGGVIFTHPPIQNRVKAKIAIFCTFWGKCDQILIDIVILD